MRIPGVSPVGVVDYPAEYSGSPRPISATRRVFAAVMLATFLLVVVLTSVMSLGGYCLTSDGGDTRHLPASIRPGGERSVE